MACRDQGAYGDGILEAVNSYAEEYGPLEYRELDILPPVFGRYGGYSPSGIEEKSNRILRKTTEDNLVPPIWNDDLSTTIS